MNPFEFKFLQESMWQWAIFILALILILKFWHGVLKEID